MLEQLGFAAPDGSQFTDDPFRQDIAQQLRGFFLLALQRLLEFEQLQIVFDYGEALVERCLALGGQRSFKGGVSLPFFRQLLLEAGDFLQQLLFPLHVSHLIGCFRALRPTGGRNWPRRC